MANFLDCVNLVFSAEGGYVDDPDDAGGETKFGISKKSYPNIDIKNITQNDAREIYRRDFWDKIKGDEIKSFEIAKKLLLLSVNAGVSQAVKVLQWSLHDQGYDLKVDGIVGKQTLKVINFDNFKVTELFFLIGIIKFYKMLVDGRRSNSKFLYGWLNRAFL